MIPTTDPRMVEVYEREREHRPHWPQDYGTAQTLPLIVAVLRTLVLHPSAQRRAPAPRGIKPPRDLELDIPRSDSGSEWVEWTPAPAPARKPYSTPAGPVDLKRRASGERDD